MASGPLILRWTRRRFNRFLLRRPAQWRQWYRRGERVLHGYGWSICIDMMVSRDRGTPSHHPNFHGIFHEINHQAMGYPLDCGNPQMGKLDNDQGKHPKSRLFFRLVKTQGIPEFRIWVVWSIQLWQGLPNDWTQSIEISEIPSPVHTKHPPKWSQLCGNSLLNHGFQGGV